MELGVKNVNVNVNVNNVGVNAGKGKKAGKALAAAISAGVQAAEATGARKTEPSGLEQLAQGCGKAYTGVVDMYVGAARAYWQLCSSLVASEAKPKKKAKPRAERATS